MSNEVIYLDHAAATPLDERVLAAMQPYFTALFYNPSSPYSPALAVRRDYEAAKAMIAQAIGGKGDELVMTAGATESINLAFSSVGGHVVTANIEHHAVLEAAKRHEYTLVKSDERGIVSAQVVKAAIRPDTRLVSIALANNELGTIQPLREIAAVVLTEREARLSRGDTTPIYLHSDASQGAGLLDLHVARLGVDMLTLNAGKVYGPKQVGLLWTASHVRLAPQIVGGGQERGIRSGTENVAGTIGFAKAMELAERHRKSQSQRLAELRDDLQAKLLAAFPDAVVSGSQKRRLPGHLHISLPGLDAERLVFSLEMRGVLVATGSACAANKGTRSHVLTAIGLDPSVADGSLRLTLGRLSTEENTTRAASIIIEEITRERQRTAR
ncbi:cysteine desulfurase family protein [Streptomyces caniscabiei]|uniref:cysteine desulfurase family protein n=1 Tax=Streptomyces caniscabiei TaxID=2746961 RepID=UPI0029B94B32|nr:cysteine desulfurase family protein [Streptomyces caniscabiei]MDX2776688.1 cysteine desulfurase family protein [Streptomyces caniscabiei]